MKIFKSTQYQEQAGNIMFKTHTRPTTLVKTQDLTQDLDAGALYLLLEGYIVLQLRV
jgi:hypothetical protein